MSGMRGEGGGVVPRGAGASGALVIVLLQVMLLAISSRGLLEIVGADVSDVKPRN